VSQDILFITGVNILMAWSVYIILLSGSLSFANGGFMALGAYGSGLLTLKWGMDFYAALALAGIGTGLVGALLAYPALRTRGVYLILVTVGLSFIIQTLIQNTDYVGGVRGMTGMTGTTNGHIWGLIAIVGAGLFWLSRCHLQRQLDAVREDERVAASLGIDVVYLKIVCFAVGAALAAIAGGLYSHYMVFINPDHFNIFVSIYVVLYVVLGGVNNFLGPVIGASIMTLLPELVRGLQSYRPLIFGAVIIVLLLVRPNGLLSFRLRTLGAHKEGGA
jgi:branched-chain amino acid transport system permease protein